jgi:hypothetical protein
MKVDASRRSRSALVGRGEIAGAEDAVHHPEEEIDNLYYN